MLNLKLEDLFASSQQDENTWVPGELRSTLLPAGTPGSEFCTILLDSSSSSNANRSTTSNGGSSSPSPLQNEKAGLGSAGVIEVAVNRLAPSNPKVQEGISDLTHLSYLNEPGILHNLHTRYVGNHIYAFAGPVLIALNPCKSLPLYTAEVANVYKGKCVGMFVMSLLCT